MEGKTVRESAVIISQLMGPQETNNAGNVHGGVIMKLIDSTAGVVAVRHARSNAVTASIDRLDFLYPAYAGDLVTFKASLNYTGHTSMEIGVRVETENLISGEKRHTASAYLTYVALDKSGHPEKFHRWSWKRMKKNAVIAKLKKEEKHGSKRENANKLSLVNKDSNLGGFYGTK